MPRWLAIGLILCTPLWTVPAQGAAACGYVEPVCSARKAVFRISAYDPAASAIRIGPSTLVTNRHVVADATVADVFLTSGARVQARVVPSSYTGDLILLEADLPPGPALAADLDGVDGKLHTVGYDLAVRDIIVNAPGALLLAAGDTPLARIQHLAHSAPGNSGGAIVDEKGDLVGIATSGGDGRSEAIPVRALKDLEQASGPDKVEESRAIGQAYRKCDQVLDDARRERGALDDKMAGAIENYCVKGGNRVQLELAAQAFGQRGDFERSVTLFMQALEQDPQSISTRLGLATTYHLSGEFSKEVPIVKALLDIIPHDKTLQRYAIQAGKWGGDPELATRGLELIKQHDPAQAAAAERFLATDLPPPRRAPRLQ